MFALPLLSLLAVFQGAVAAPLCQPRATECNGHAELCDRSYGNVTFLGAHDSFAFSEDPFALARDQEVSITDQLNLGVRLLQAQSHMKDNTLHFCHTSCALFDGGTVLSYLTTVKSWLDAHPSEVLTLLFTNPEGVSLPDVWKPAFEQSGVAGLAYTPPAVPTKQSDWPTLGDLISSGKRVIIFLDAGADTDRSVPYILPEFEMIWETPFSVTDPSFPCSVDRTAGPLATADHMYMINHSLNKDVLDTGIIVSDPLDASTTNDVDSIKAQSAKCTQFANGRSPNFVLLDFVNIGEGLQAVDELNGFSS